MDLTQKTCIPCRIGEPTLTGKEIQEYLSELRDGWTVGTDPDKLIKEYEFDNFSKAIEFINKVAEIAEREGHHPNIYLHSYKMVKLELWTHKIGGLHKNDFILASKINQLNK